MTEVALGEDAPKISAGVRNLLESFLLAIILTGLSYGVAISFDWINTVNHLEAFAVLTSYMSTYLCVKERRLNYPIGAVSTAAYALLFYQQGLMASTILNLYLTPSLVYGWFRWRQDSNTRPVGLVGLKWYPMYLLVTLVAYLGALGLNNLLGGTMAWSDTFILVGSILAQFLLDNKKIETWVVWLAVNIFAVYTYAEAGLTLAAFQYVFFLINTFYGFHSWKQSRARNQQKVAGV